MTPEQFQLVVVALGEAVLPVSQERPPLLPANPFEDMDDLYFETKFRYTKKEVCAVVNCLNLPEKVVLPKEYTCTGTTMLLVVLFRLSFPTTLLLMERVFGIKFENCHEYSIMALLTCMTNLGQS